jgi:hypothetical protein
MLRFIFRLLDHRNLRRAVIHTPNLCIAKQGSVTTTTVLAFRTG